MTRAAVGWLQTVHNGGDSAGATLIFFPPAGSSASTAAALRTTLPAGWSLVGVRYPARGPRRREPPASTIRELALGCLPEVGALATTSVLYGHSFGALVAYDVAQLLQRGGLAVAGLLVSGSAAPTGELPGTSTGSPSGGPVDDLDDDRLLALVARQGGTGRALIDNDELMRVMLPVIRSDVALARRYINDHPARLTAPVMALGGRADPGLPTTALQTWRGVTESWLGCELVDGAHFFYLQDPSAIAAALHRHWAGLVGTRVGWGVGGPPTAAEGRSP